MKKFGIVQSGKGMKKGLLLFRLILATENEIEDHEGDMFPDL